MIRVAIVLAVFVSLVSAARGECLQNGDFDVTVCDKRKDYRAALEAKGLTIFRENFKHAKWPRRPQAAESITRKKIKWTSYVVSGRLTTVVDFSFRRIVYILFSASHGNRTDLSQPQTDGVSGSSKRDLYAVGFQVDRSTAGPAEIVMTFDGNHVLGEEGEGVKIGTHYNFFGVISDKPFRDFDIWETSGHPADEVESVFFKGFMFGR